MWGPRTLNADDDDDDDDDILHFKSLHQFLHHSSFVQLFTWPQIKISKIFDQRGFKEIGIGRF